MSTNGRRLALPALIGASVLALIAVAWRARSHDAHDLHDGHDGPQAAPTAAEAAAARAPGATIAHPARIAVAARGPGDAPDPQPAAAGGASDPGAAPSPDEAERGRPAPGRTAFTPKDTIDERVAELALLDKAEQKLEGDLAAAQQAGNADRAKTIEAELARVRAVRTERRAALDRMRGHGSPRP